MAAPVGNVVVSLKALTGKFEKDIKGAGMALSGIGKAATKAAAAASAAFAGIGAAAVAAAQGQIKAELQLQNAFKATGKELDLQGFRDFAAELQRTTTFGDETTIMLGSMLARMGQTQDQMRETIPVIQDLATATGMELTPAAKLFGNAMQGEVGELKAWDVSLTNAEKATLRTADAQERLAIILPKLKEKFEGVSAAIADTAGGALEQAKNGFGDLAEKVGFFLELPVKEFLQGATGLFDRLGESLVANRQGIVDWSLTILDAGLSAVSLLARGIGQLAKGFQAFSVVANLAISELIGLFAKLLRGVSFVLGGYEQLARLVGMSSLADGIKLGIDTISGLAKSLDGVKIVFKKTAADSIRSMDRIDRKVKRVRETLINMSVGARKMGQDVVQFVGQQAGVEPKKGATKTPATGEIATPKVKESVQSFGENFASTMASASGELGDTVNAAIQGADLGGPIGSVAMVAANMLLKTEGFKKIVAFLDQTMGVLVKALEPLIDALMPVIAILGMMLAVIAEQLAPVLEELTPVFQLVFEILRAAGVTILVIVKAIGDAWNGLVSVIERMIDKIPGVNVNFDRFKFNMNGVNRALDRFINTSFGAARRMVEAAGMQEESSQDLAETVHGLNRELSNIPTGFKLSLREFQVTQGMQLAPALAGGASGGIVNNWNIEALDLEDAARKLDQIEEFKSLQGGHQATERRPFSVPRAGG